ncbi:asparaginase [Halomonas binhaiensis]|uniref:Asparaginase n=1 Tax=Halomonas binhaiensis TaxID=2562282 RepID=A0A5C1NB12_9GAMM|nr:asparaginase [Halomonas binhaiensis]QEM80130.1 asparaginase [Halomonas binhaiensis]
MLKDREQPISLPAVEVFRGEILESLHRATAVACRADGRVVFALGDPYREVFPRSGLKPFQALAQVETGAVDALSISNEELALSCASHSAEPGHINTVSRWLQRLGMNAQHLACGAQVPYDTPVAKALFLSGAQETPLHNNCSGKHTGMLSACRQMGWPVEGYQELDHPLQRHIANALGELSGENSLPRTAIDGCSAPTFAMPLAAAARAFAQLADPSRISATRQQAVERIFTAMRAHPWHVAGTHRSCTDFITACPDTVVKMGAEGFYGISLRHLGLGIAIKVDDGAERAGQVAAGAVLEALKAVAPEHADMVAAWTRKTLINVGGLRVGSVQPSQQWLDSLPSGLQLQ